MGRGDVPGAFEQVILLTLAGFEDEASGRQVYERLTEASGREASVAAVHITLSRLEEKGWAACRTSSPEAGRGGKPRRHYRLSPQGAQVLTTLRRQLEDLWANARAHPLLDSEARS